MAKKQVKRPVYDGNTCLLYDFMVVQNLTEEDVAKKMGLDKERIEILGEELFQRTPWEPISRWIRIPASIPYKYVLQLCNVLNAPIEALVMRSRILNGMAFDISQYGCQVKKKSDLRDIYDFELIKELKRRGYLVYQEVC